MKFHLSRRTSVAAVVVFFSVLAALNAYFFSLEFPDEAEYWSLAQNVVHAGTFSYDGMTPSAYRPPLVPWILTPFAATGMSMAAVRPLFVGFFAATGALVGVFLCRVFPRSLLFPPLGTAFVLGHPLYLFSAGNLYPQEVLTPLLLAALLLACLNLPVGRNAVLRSIAIGVLTGASVLTSAPAVFSLLPVFAVLAWEDWRAVRDRKIFAAYRFALAGLCVLLCVAPHLARNSRHVHPGLYLSLNSGIALLMGNSPGTTPTSGVDVDLSDQAGPAHESEFDTNRRLTEAAITNVRKAPAYYASLYLRKLCAGFGSSVQTLTHGENKLATIAMEAYMALVWIGTGLIFIPRLRRGNAVPALRDINCRVLGSFALLVLTAYFLSVAGYSMFFMRLRFRIPVDVALATLAATGWGLAWLFLRASRTRKG